MPQFQDILGTVCVTGCTKDIYHPHSGAPPLKWRRQSSPLWTYLPNEPFGYAYRAKNTNTFRHTADGCAQMITQHEAAMIFTI